MLPIETHNPLNRGPRHPWVVSENQPECRSNAGMRSIQDMGKRPMP